MNMAAAAEAAGEGMAVNPGFFSLPLGLFREEANEHLRTRISSCQRKLHSGAVIMDVAVLNLLGMLYYSVRQLGNALEALEEALRRSPESLNTLENIRHTYQLLGRHRDAGEVQERLTSLLAQPLARARCLAEQAYAITFGQVEGECLPRLRLSAKYFRAALRAGAGSHDEEANWNLCFCVNMLKIADNLYTEQKPRETEFLECLEACLKAYKLTHQGNASLRAMALRTLVTLSSKTSGVNENHINTLLHRYGAKYYYDNSDRCYDEAMKIDPYTPDNYTRFARKLSRDYFKSKQKPTLDHAMFLLDTFIAHHAFTLPARVPEDNPLCNLWFPLVTRGRIRLQLYRKKLCRNVGILHQAYADLSNSMKIQRTTESLTDLGEVCHLIAMHDPRHKDFKWYMNAALAHFMDATLCLDGDSKSYIHLKYAACLADYREPRAAAESYKRAAELATIPWQFKESLKGLSRCLMEMYEEDPQRENPLAELAFWLDYTLTATTAANVGNILKQMFDEHRSPMEIVMHQLARQKKRRTLDICLEYLNDTEERNALLDLCKQASIADDEDCPDLDIVTESMVNLSLSTSPRQSFVTSTPNKSVPEACDSGFESNITNQSGMSSVEGTPVLSMEESVCQTQPSAVQSQPSASQPQPSASQPQPSASPPQPSASQPQPSISQPQPSASPPQPSTSQPQPSASQPQSLEPPQARTQPSPSGVQVRRSLCQPNTSEFLPSPKAPAPSAVPSVAPGQPQAEQAQEATANTAAAQAAAAKVRAHNELLQSIPPEVPLAKNQHGKTYDFFVSFSTKDAQWVYHTLLPYMEINLKFKGCVADRDFELGKPVTDNIIDGFDRSVCTLLILSPHFLASAFCKYELDQVLTRAIELHHKLLPIKLSPCDIPAKLQCYTFLDATHAINFDRLVLNLERHCTGNLDD